MNGRWSPERKAFLVRDLVRDYCQVYEGLEEQRRRFDHEGAVSYSSIRDLLGEAMRKGVFWRLKDTAHHLFRNSQSQTPDKDAILLWQYSGSRHPDGLVSQQPVEALIDWCVGYAFHECAKLREDDVVDHFFLTSTHNWLLFFTNKGRVYRLKAYELPEGSRDSKGQHVANLLQFGPDETIQTVLSIPNYDVAKYLVLATRSGKVKKTALAEYDSPRQGGLIAVRLMTGENGENADELIGAALCNAEDDIILVSKLGMSLKFQANDEQLRPMGRQTAGVQGMKFREGDELLAMDVVWGDSDKDLFVVTNEGFAKRTAISEYRLQGRNGFGVKAVQLAEGRGSLVGAVIVEEDDQIMAIMKSGKVIRSNVDEVKRTGRTTQGVTFAKPDKNDEIISIARNEEKDDESAESGESAEKTESAEHGTNATVNEGASASSEAATEANAGNGDGENVEA